MSETKGSDLLERLLKPIEPYYARGPVGWAGRCDPVSLEDINAERAQAATRIQELEKENAALTERIYRASVRRHRRPPLPKTGSGE